MLGVQGTRLRCGGQKFNIVQTVWFRTFHVVRSFEDRVDVLTTRPVAMPCTGAPQTRVLSK